MFRELLTCFGAMEEPRQAGKMEHGLVDVLAITVCAVLAHAESFEDIDLYGQYKEKWLRQFLDLPNGIPSHDTFRWVFILVNAEQFKMCFLAWTRAVFSPVKDGKRRRIAVDGKAMRRSFDRRKGSSPLYVVSTFATQSGLTLTQRVVAETSGEAEVLLPLLKGLDLAGALISLDALYARKTIAGEIVDQGADYLTGLKGNNRKDHAWVVEFFSEHAFTRTGTMKAAFDAFDGPSGPVQDIDGLWPVRGSGGQDAAAEPGKTAARWGKKVRDGAPLEPLSSVPRKGSGKPEPFVSFFVELIEQDPDITLVELRAALLAAHGMSFSTSGIDALLRRHGYTYKKSPDRPGAQQASGSKSKA